MIFRKIKVHVISEASLGVGLTILFEALGLKSLCLHHTPPPKKKAIYRFPMNYDP